MKPEGCAHGTPKELEARKRAKETSSSSISPVFPQIDGCRVSLLIGLGLLILKDFHAWELLKFCFIGYTFAVIKTPREPHFPSRNQRYVPDSTRLPF
jgi:hypothetical protein